MTQVSRTLEYRRARWFAGNQNLEELTRKAWLTFETQIERTINRKDGSCICGMRSRDTNQSGFGIRCVRYTDKQAVGVVPMAPLVHADIGEHFPADGENFLNTDFMALIHDNHVIVLNAGRNAAMLREFLYELFHKAGFEEETRRFDLQRVGSVDKLAMIEAIGVKSIDLSLGISEATAVDLSELNVTDGFWDNTKGAIGKAFRSIVTKDTKISQLSHSTNGTVKVSINVKKGDIDFAKEGLNSLAEAITNDENADDYVIVLRNTETIRANEVSIKKSVSLETHANSVSVPHAWEQMQNFLTELTDTGQIQV